MKILWVNNIFLHPTTKGGQIRTLEMLRKLHNRNEIHYVAFENPAEPEGVVKSTEYCSRVYPIPSPLTRRFSPAFFAQVARSVVSPTPVLVERKRSAHMRHVVDDLLRREAFDSLVCDFLTPSINVPQLRRWVLFQHNVETMIWRRYVDTATDPAKRWYFRQQAKKLFRYERDVCRGVAHVVAVSDVDAALMREMFSIDHVSAVPTGVNIDYFQPPDESSPAADLVFVGSMDWMPNVDGMLWFVEHILPLIRRSHPQCSVVIAGRTPVAKVRELAERDPLITVTGTVPDVRPYLWGSNISIVPLRVGGGTRLKIYESMAARIPVVSTTIGAEGLEYRDGETLRIADTPGAFAERCVELLKSAAERERLSRHAWQMVASRFSWDRIAEQFEQTLTGAAVRS